MQVSYFYRKPGAFFSVERAFDATLAALPPTATARKHVCHFARGVFGRLCNIAVAFFRQGEINHIAGDVHYLAFSLARSKTVLTVLDCRNMEHLTGWRRELIRLVWFEWPCARVSAVTVISEKVRQELLSYTSCPPERISVVPVPLLAEFVPYPKPFNSSRPCILQVGTSAHKNLQNVVLALAGIPCRLLIVGAVAPALAAQLNRSGVEWASFSGISDARVLECYRESDIVTFCSFYEGFGMPVIEGNGVGRPVVASDIEPIREVAADAACLVDPHSVESIRTGILRIISDGAYRDRLVQNGFANAARFRPAHVAQQFCDLYTRMMAPHDSTSS